MRLHRVLFPALLPLALLFFAATVAASLALALVLPVVALAGAVFLASRFHVVGAVRLLGAGLRGVGGALSYAAACARCFAFPLRGPGDVREARLADFETPVDGVVLRPPMVPALLPLLKEAAEATGTRPVDYVCVSADVTLGIADARVDGQRARVLFVGLGLLHGWSVDALRAGLAHEMGHARAGHLWLARWAGHILDVLLDALLRFAWWSPARLSAWLALAVLEPLYLPWRRQQEYDADRLAARAVGANHVVDSLRAVREWMASYPGLLAQLKADAEAHGRAPLRLAEAAASLTRQVPARLRKQLSVRQEGDPLDLGRRTHPPLSARIAALAGQPARPARDGRNAVEALGLAGLDARLTRIWLQHLRVREWMEPAALSLQRPGPARGTPAPVNAHVPAVASGLELDLERRGVGAPAAQVLVHRHEREVLLEEAPVVVGEVLDEAAEVALELLPPLEVPPGR